jgi:hypothetical protein
MSEPAWELSALERVDFTDMEVPAGLWQPTPPPPYDTSDSPFGDGGGGAVFVDLEPQPDGSGARGLDRLSSILSLIPIVGTVKDVIEGITGEDLITGKTLSTRKRIFNFAAAAADLIGFGIAGRLAKGTGIAAKVIKGVHDGGKIADAVNNAEDIYTVAEPGPL